MSISARPVRLIGENRELLGFCEKSEAHQKGLRHLAFSVFLFDNAGRMLLQRRALSKYHCGGLWSNACCSHPSSFSSIAEEAKTRLLEELGIQTALKEVFSFSYRAEFENGLIENELDFVLIGTFEGDLMPDPAEVSEVRWISESELFDELDQFPERFTVWFRRSVKDVFDAYHRAKL